MTKPDHVVLEVHLFNTRQDRENFETGDLVLSGVNVFQGVVVPEGVVVAQGVHPIAVDVKPLQTWSIDSIIHWTRTQ